jgi:hypothetical protein
MEIATKQIKVNEKKTDQCICRTEKKCKRCHQTIKVGEIHFRYGSADFPFFMCIVCKDKEIMENIVDSERRMAESSEKFGVTIEEYKKYIEPQLDRFDKRLHQFYNFKSPFFHQKDRLGVPDSIFLKITNSPYFLSKTTDLCK